MKTKKVLKELLIELAKSEGYTDCGGDFSYIDCKNCVEERICLRTYEMKAKFNRWIEEL